MRIIEVLWEGPFSMGEIKTKNGSSDYGLYQIYGTHTVFGANSLLYIGLSKGQPFSARFQKHKEWINWEPDETKIYIGRIGKSGIALSEEDWKDYISHAERLLIYFCCPPYNSSSIVGYGNETRNTIVLNLGKKAMIPYEVSTLYNESLYWEENSNWKVQNLRCKTLHEAIIYVLKDKAEKSASFQEIADEIQKNNLWERPSDGQSPEDFQIRLRTTVQAKYKDLFEEISKDIIRLKE